MSQTSKTKIITLLRNILQDNIQNGVDIFTYTNSSIFTLSEPNTQSVTSVAINDVSSGVDYTYNSSTQKVTVNSTLNVDDVVEINHTYYSNYSDSELVGYIKNALAYISINQYTDFVLDTDDDMIYPNPTVAEINLIATVAGIIIDPGNRSYRTPDFSVTVRNTLPVADMISKTIAIFKKSSAGMYSIT